MDTALQDIVDYIVDHTSITTHQGKNALAIAVTNCVLLDCKQKDYGPNNISVFGELGVIVRVNDKFERLKHLTKPLFEGRSADGPKNESIEDTWKDIANYATIALMLRNGVWTPK